MFNVLVAYPHLAFLMKILANLFGSYGMAIVLVTLFVRILLWPLIIAANRQRAVQQFKVQLLQPRVHRAIQQKKKAHGPHQTKKAEAQIVNLYRRNHVHFLLRPLPIISMVVQWPLLVVMYMAFRFTPAVNSELFNWGVLGKLPLGQPNVILFLAVVVFYLGEAIAGLLSMPKEQRGNVKFFNYVPVLIIGFFALISPAGIQIYLIISGITECLSSSYSARHLNSYRQIAQKELK